MDEETLTRMTSLYAGRHKAFLATRHPDVYAQKEKAGTLEAHLLKRGREAAEYYLTLEAQMEERAKAIANTREREAYIGGIPSTVAELVREELVHAWP